MLWLLSLSPSHRWSELQYGVTNFFVFKKLKTFSAKPSWAAKTKIWPRFSPFLPLDISSKLSSSPSSPLFFHCKNKNVNDNSPQFINKVCNSNSLQSLHTIEIFLSKSVIPVLVVVSLLGTRGILYHAANIVSCRTAGK